MILYRCECMESIDEIISVDLEVFCLYFFCHIFLRTLCESTYLSIGFFALSDKMRMINNSRTMCGIFGIATTQGLSGDTPLVEHLVKGIERLEYRGYDSAGVALYDSESHSIIRHKALGKVAHLESLVRSE